MRKRARRLAILVASVAAIVLVASAALAISFTTPNTNPFAPAADAAGDPVPFDVAVSGATAGQPVFVQQCDGVPSSSANYTVGDHCDFASGNTPVNADAGGVAVFPANDPDHRLSVFKGDSPQSKFTCLSANDPDPGSGLPTFRNCQVRVSVSTPGDTSAQAYFTLALPNATGQTTTTTAAPTTTTAGPTTTTTAGPTTTSTTVAGATTTTVVGAPTTTTTAAPTTTSTTVKPTTTTVAPTTTTVPAPTSTSTTSTTIPEVTTTTTKATTTTVKGVSTSTTSSSSTSSTVATSGNTDPTDTTFAVSGVETGDGSSGSSESSSSGSGSGLPTTGATTMPMIAIALMLLGAGVAFGSKPRRRHR